MCSLEGALCCTLDGCTILATQCIGVEVGAMCKVLRYLWTKLCEGKLSIDWPLTDKTENGVLNRQRSRIPRPGSFYRVQEVLLRNYIGYQQPDQQWEVNRGRTSFHD